MKKLIAIAGLVALAIFAAPFAVAGLPAPDVAALGGLEDGLPLIGLAGLLVNKDSIEAAFTALKTTFNNAFSAAPSVWDKIAMKVPSTTGQNDYAWLSSFPKMRKWVGDKVVKSLEAFKYTIANFPFEATVAVKRDDIEDDNLGIYGPQAQMAGYSAKQWPDELIMELVNGAFANECYDGQYFFDTDHPVGEASVSNKLTVALSAATQAAAIASYGAGRTAMMMFKDEEGRPLNCIPNVLLVPPALEAIALALVNNDRLDDGKANPYKGTAQVVVDARLTSSTAWFLLDTTKPVKPFIFQERKAPVFVSQTSMENDDVFNKAEYKFGAEARGNAGYGLWQLAVGSTGAG